MQLEMPVRTLDYALMGVAAGIIAGLTLVFLFGVTFSALAASVNSIEMAMRIRP